MIKTAIIGLLAGICTAQAVASSAAERVYLVFLVTCATFYVVTVAEEIWNEIVHRERG